MSWETAALLAAVGFALKGFACKAACREGADEMGLMAWVTAVSAAGFGVIQLVSPPDSIRNFPDFSRLLFFCVIGAVLANVCYFKAIRRAPLSIAMPMFGLSPAFMIFTSRWMLGEYTDVPGIFGILSVAAGIAILYSGPDKAEVDPKDFRLGFFYALATSLIWSVTANLDKRAVGMSNPFFYPFILQCILLPFYFAGVPRLNPGSISRTIRIPAARKWIVLAGLMDLVVLAAQMTAILKTNVAYVITVKRSGAILAVLLGWKIFGEKQILRRMAACLLIVAGVSILLLMP